MTNTRVHDSFSTVGSGGCVFLIGGAAKLTIHKGCEFAACTSAGDGGAIAAKDKATITAEDSTFTQGVSPIGGGLVYVTAAVTANFLRCTFSKGGPDSGRWSTHYLQNPCSAGGVTGGGIEAGGTGTVVNVIDSTITECLSKTGGGVMCTSGAKFNLIRSRIFDVAACINGAGITAGGGEVTITDSVLEDLYTEGADVGTSGGALAVNPMGVLNIFNTVIRRARIANAYCAGAAIWTNPTGGLLVMRNVSIHDSMSPIDTGIAISAHQGLDQADLSDVYIEVPCNVGSKRGISLFNFQAFQPVVTEDPAAALGGLRGVHALRPPGCTSADSVIAGNLFESKYTDLSRSFLSTCANSNLGRFGRPDATSPYDPTMYTSTSDESPGPSKELCGPHAMCTDAPVFGSSSITTPVCSCSTQLGNHPYPSDLYQATVSPFILGCTTPRQGTGVGIAAVATSDVVFKLTKPSSGSFTLTLKMKGTNIATSSWSINPASVKSWMALDTLSGSLRASTEVTEDEVFDLTANTSMVASRAQPYAATLQITVQSDLTTLFEVPVIFFVYATDDVPKSVWGEVTLDGSCLTETVPPRGSPMDAFFQTLTVVKFTSCDLESQPIDYQASYVATLTRTIDGVATPALVTFKNFGLYEVGFVLPTLGNYKLRVSLNSVALGGGELDVTTTCPDNQFITPDGLLCGCARGMVADSQGKCTTCVGEGKSSEVGDEECTRCIEGYYAEEQTGGEIKCIACSTLKGSTCPWGSNIGDVLMVAGFWRISSESTETLKCLSSDACPGGPPETCDNKHEGPKCWVCSDEGHFMNKDDGTCLKCPSPAVPAVVLLCIVFSCCMGMVFIYALANRPSKGMTAASKAFGTLLLAFERLGPSKIKMAVTYYQIISSLNQTFHLDPLMIEFGELLKVVNMIDFQWSDLAYPRGCVGGGFFSKLIIVTMVPIGLAFVIPLFIFIGTFVTSFFGMKAGIYTAARRESASRRGSFTNEFKGAGSNLTRLILGFLPIVLLVTFVMLPGVSRTIFSSWDCVTYEASYYSTVFLTPSFSLVPSHSSLLTSHSSSLTPHSPLLTQGEQVRGAPLLARRS